MKSHPISLRRYNYRLEGIAVGVIVATLLIVVLLIQREVNRQFLIGGENDVTKFSIFFSGHIEAVEESFAAWAVAQGTSSLRPAHPVGFSDFYRLNADFQITQILHASPNNGLYEGFTFTRGALREKLEGSQRWPATSALLRGYEDEQPSLYFSHRVGANFYLGRLDLGYFERLLSRYTVFSGQPVLMSTAAGVVMIGSDPNIRLPVVPINEPNREIPSYQTLTLNGSKRAAVTRYIPDLGVTITVLVSTELYDHFILTSWLITAGLIFGLLVVIGIKNERIAALIIRPQERLSERIDAVAKGKAAPLLPLGDYRIREFAELNQRFTDMARDVQKREMALIKAKAQAETAEQAKSEFIANISHEIRSPLTVILGMNDLLLQRELSAEVLEKLQHIADSGQYLLGIINDVLDLSKIEAGRMEIKSEPFRLNALIDGITARKRPLLNPAVTLEVEQQHDVDEVVGDAIRIEQVLTNLLDNAIKFTQSGTVHLRTKLTETADGDCKLDAEIEDTGIGISATQLPELFDAFAQADAGVNRAYHGTGLGLAISKQLIELMGGRLFATSQVNRGSVFSFEIKLGRATPASSAKPDDSPKCYDHLSGLSILIVDDSATIRMLVAEMLKQHGCITETLPGAEAAISHVQNHPASIDLILMDIQMPGMDGITATRELKAIPETCALPIIGITAGVLGEQRQRIIDAGASAVIAKPIDLPALSEAIHQVI